MQFVHSTITRQNRLEHCIPLSTTPRSQYDLLFLYEKYAEITSFSLIDSPFEYYTLQTIPIESPIQWIENQNNFIFVFTQNLHLLILNGTAESNQLFSPILSLDLSLSFENPPTINFEFFIFSSSKDYLLISSKSDEFFIVNIKDISNPVLQMFPLDDSHVIDATFSQEPNVFIVLIEKNRPENEQENNPNKSPQNTPQKPDEEENLIQDTTEEIEEEEEEEEETQENQTETKKKVTPKKSTPQPIKKTEFKTKEELTFRDNQQFLFFDAESLTILKTEQVPDDFNGFIPSLNNSSGISPYFKNSSIEISNKNSIPINSPVRCYSQLNNGLFACQLESNNVIFMSDDFKTVQTFSEFPPLEKIWIVSNLCLICRTETSTLYIEIPKLKKTSSSTKKTGSKSSSFKSLRIINEIVYNPPIKSLFFDKNESILLANTRDDGIYRLTNTICIDQGKPRPGKADNSTEIFSPVPNVVIGTNETTQVICGEAKVSKSPTVGVLTFELNHYQVYANGIKDIDEQAKPIYESTKNIVCAASNGVRMILGHEDGTILLFHGCFSDCDSITISNLRGVAICDKYLAISEINNVSLYDFSLNKFQEFPLPSVPVSMAFCNHGRELYVALHCGAVLRITKHSTTYIGFFNENPQLISPRESQNYIFILSDFLYIYTNAHLIKTDLDDVDCLCASSDDNNPYDSILYFIKNKRLYSSNVSNIDFHYRMEKADNQPPNNIENIFEFNHKFYGISKLEDNNSLLINLQDHTETIQIDGSISCFVVKDDYLFLSVANSIYVLKEIESKLAIEFTHQLDSPPAALSPMYNSLIIAIGKEIKIAQIESKTLRFEKTTLSLSAPVKTIISNGLPWVILEDSTVIILTFNFRLSEFEIICYTQFKHILFDQFCIIDDRTIAAVSDSRHIHFLRMPERLAQSTNNRKLTVAGRYSSPEPIIDIKRINDTIVYVTNNNEVHVLTCFNQDTRYRQLLVSQRKLVTQIRQIFTFSEPDQNSLCEQYNVVDTDLLNTFKCQHHDCKEDQEAFNRIILSENQKIIF